MSPDEQERVLDRARLSLREEFRAVEEGLARSHEEQLGEVRAECDARFDIWSRAFAEDREERLRARASDTAVLALAMARKIIRDTAAGDAGFVVRTLETVLYKLEEAHRLVVTVHPEDASLLEGDPELKARLGIRQVIADRRVARGGCLVKAGGREWDATLGNQLDTLAGVVEEVLASEASAGSDEGDGDADGPS